MIKKCHLIVSIVSIKYYISEMLYFLIYKLMVIEII